MIVPSISILHLAIPKEVKLVKLYKVNKRSKGQSPGTVLLVDKMTLAIEGLRLEKGKNEKDRKYKRNNFIFVAETRNNRGKIEEILLPYPYLENKSKFKKLEKGTLSNNSWIINIHYDDEVLSHKKQDIVLR